MGKIAFYLILLCHTSLFVVAQYEPTRNFSVKDGLPSGVVYDCLQDKQGFMWFATAAGLARFDGANFKVFTTEDGLSNNEVLQIALDKDGSIWVFPFGTSACIYDPANQKFYTEKSYPQLKKIKDLKPSISIRNSILGILGNFAGKTFLFESKKIQLINNAVDLWPLSKDSMISFTADRRSFLFTNNDSLKLDFHVPEINISFSKSPDWGKWKIFINSNQTTELKLYEFINATSVVQRALFRSRYVINNVTKYDRKIYITTVSGVYSTDTLLGQIEYFFSGKNISKAYVDKNGNEWLCSLSGDGVYLRLKDRVKQLIDIPGVHTDNITSLYMNISGLLYCGDGDGNIYTINPSEKVIKPTPVVKLPEAVRGIQLYKNSFLAYSNYKLYLGGKFIPQISGAFKSVVVDSNNNLLIGTHGFLKRYSVSEKKIDTIGDGLRFSTLAYIGSRLFFGNNKGLFEKINYQNRGEEIPVKRDEVLLRQPVNHLLATGDNVLWIATNTTGIVACFDDKIVGHFNTLSNPSLTSNICKKFFFDKQSSSIWVATNKGLNKIDYRWSGDSLSANITSVTSSEGLNDDDVNDVFVKEGKVYAATIKGICIFNTDLVKQRIPIRIIDVGIKNYFDSLSSIRSSYDLSSRENNISISYTGICFTCNNKLLYQYRLLGIGKDTGWKTTTANMVEFGELQKGNYTFQVRTDNDNMQELSFHIQPAFWQTEWFYLLVIAGILGIFYFIIKFIAQQIRKREIEKTLINKRFAELEYQALQAQMNPHFVFNAMNTLQNYILKNESENASEYLAKFARLMRLFLESSRNKFIELRNEIELLSNYIELEQARMQNNFQYHINVNPEVEMETKIPSVMIQPFVENAILHGLRYKTGNDGLLELSFTSKDNVLECTIRDNGIGREESSIINESKEKLYKSQALDIIDEKISSLKEINNVDIKIKTEDNVAENGRGIGTSVIIQFRLNN